MKEGNTFSSDHAVVPAEPEHQALPVLRSSANVLGQSALLSCEAEAVLACEEPKGCGWLRGAKRRHFLTTAPFSALCPNTHPGPSDRVLAIRGFAAGVRPKSSWQSRCWSAFVSTEPRRRDAGPSERSRAANTVTPKPTSLTGNIFPLRLLSAALQSVLLRRC